jgi:hypothetical protein
MIDIEKLKNFQGKNIVMVVSDDFFYKYLAEFLKEYKVDLYKVNSTLAMGISQAGEKRPDLIVFDKLTKTKYGQGADVFFSNFFKRSNNTQNSKILVITTSENKKLDSLVEDKMVDDILIIQESAPSIRNYEAAIEKMSYLLEKTNK